MKKLFLIFPLFLFDFCNGMEKLGWAQWIASAKTYYQHACDPFCQRLGIPCSYSVLGDSLCKQLSKTSEEISKEVNLNEYDKEPIFLSFSDGTTLTISRKYASRFKMLGNLLADIECDQCRGKKLALKCDNCYEASAERLSLPLENRDFFVFSLWAALQKNLNLVWHIPLARLEKLFCALDFLSPINEVFYQKLIEHCLNKICSPIGEKEVNECLAVIMNSNNTFQGLLADRLEKKFKPYYTSWKFIPIAQMATNKFTCFQASNDGSLLAYVKYFGQTPDGKNKDVLYIKNIPENTLRVFQYSFHPIEGNVRELVFSPNNNYLLLLLASKVKILDVKDLKFIKTIPADSAIKKAAFSSDSTHVRLLLSGSLIEQHFSRDNQSDLASFFDDHNYEHCFSEDLSKIASYKKGIESCIVFQDFDKNIRKNLDFSKSVGYCSLSGDGRRLAVTLVHKEGSHPAIEVIDTYSAQTLNLPGFFAFDRAALRLLNYDGKFLYGKKEDIGVWNVKKDYFFYLKILDSLSLYFVNNSSLIVQKGSQYKPSVIVDLKTEKEVKVTFAGNPLVVIDYKNGICCCQSKKQKIFGSLVCCQKEQLRQLSVPQKLYFFYKLKKLNPDIHLLSQDDLAKIQSQEYANLLTSLQQK